jgi:hypothetical protein
LQCRSYIRYHNFFGLNSFLRCPKSNHLSDVSAVVPSYFAGVRIAVAGPVLVGLWHCEAEDRLNRLDRDFDTLAVPGHELNTSKVLG